jgi:hypothetical protein
MDLSPIWVVEVNDRVIIAFKNQTLKLLYRINFQPDTELSPSMR